MKKHIDLLLAVSQETDVNKLRQINAAVHDRIRALAQIKGSSIVIGDNIKFSDTINPSYLRGLTAKVVGVNRKSVSVSCPLDSRYGRFSGSKAVRVPMTLIAS